MHKANKGHKKYKRYNPIWTRSVVTCHRSLADVWRFRPCLYQAPDEEPSQTMAPARWWREISASGEETEEGVVVRFEFNPCQTPLKPAAFATWVPYWRGHNVRPRKGRDCAGGVSRPYRGTTRIGVPPQPLQFASEVRRALIAGLISR